MDVELSFRQVLSAPADVLQVKGVSALRASDRGMKKCSKGPRRQETKGEGGVGVR